MWKSVSRLVRALPHAVVALALLLTGVTETRGAFEISHYYPGLLNADDLFMPAPEIGQFVFAQYHLYYHSERFNDRNGDEVDSITVDGPLGVPRTININVDLDQVIIAPTMIWLPKFSFLGARYGAFTTVVVGNPSVEASLKTKIGLGRSVHESSWGLGDMYVQPLWVMWETPRLDLSLGYGFYAPTGKYKAGDADNVGYGFWEHQFQGAWRMHLDRAKSFSAIFFFTGNVSHNQEGDDITPGSQLTLNWALRKNLFDDWMQVAAIGYDSWQVSPDTGSDAGNPADQVLDQVHGAGVQLGIPKFGLAFKYFHEFDAVDRFQGQAFTLTFALPLDPIAAWIGKKI